jgi:hypothetical protein
MKPSVNDVANRVKSRLTRASEICRECWPGKWTVTRRNIKRAPLWSKVLSVRLEPLGRKSLRVCLAGLRIRWIDPIAETSEWPDDSRSTLLLRLFGDGGASFFVTNSLVLDQPDQPTLSMGNRPDGLVMSRSQTSRPLREVEFVHQRRRSRSFEICFAGAKMFSPFAGKARVANLAIHLPGSRTGVPSMSRDQKSERRLPAKPGFSSH